MALWVGIEPPLECASSFQLLSKIRQASNRTLLQVCSKETVLASIRKRHNRWEVRVRRGNNPAKCKSFTKFADAKIWAHLTELELERAPAGISHAPIKLNLFEAKKRYIKSIVSQHKAKDSETYQLNAIIKRIHEIGETVYDGAMGSAGFGDAKVDLVKLSNLD